MGPIADQEDEHQALSGQNTWAFLGGDSPTTSPEDEQEDDRWKKTQSLGLQE